MTGRATSNTGSRRSSIASSTTGSGFSAISGGGSSDAFSMDRTNDGHPHTLAPGFANSYGNQTPNFTCGTPYGISWQVIPYPSSCGGFHQCGCGQYRSAGPSGNTSTFAESTPNYIAQGYQARGPSSNYLLSPLAVARRFPDSVTSGTQQRSGTLSGGETISVNRPQPGQSEFTQTGWININYNSSGGNTTNRRSGEGGGGSHSEAIRYMRIAQDEHDQLYRTLQREWQGRQS
ncbi:hypothetical protein PG991_001016 [Apiospora marii]|uniref:Uncharacterized protein n=1 Tax=Apiospora marii TaxID=335849 RepID=A0ABR1SVF6_9PEZI